MAGNPNFIVADSSRFIIIFEYRSCINISISFTPFGVFASIFFNFFPRFPIIFRILWDDICQSERLLHRSFFGHIGCRSHMSAVVAGIFIIVQNASIIAVNSRILKKLISAFQLAGISGTVRRKFFYDN